MRQLKDMKRLPILLSTFLLSSALSGAAQTQTAPYAGDAQIVIATDAAVGDKLKVLIESPAGAENVWIDLNNNGVCDPGERYEYVQYRYNSFTISSKEPITLHGEISYLDISSSKLTKLDLTAASKALVKLYAHHNQITELDLAGMSNLMLLSLDFNQLTQLDVSSNEKLLMLAATDNTLESVTLPSGTSALINRVYLYNNRLSSETIHKLIERLPQRQVTNKARIYLLDSTSPTEQNKCAPEDVALANQRAWDIYDWLGGENEGRNPYAGSHVGTTPIYSSVAHRPHIAVTEQGIELSELAPGIHIELCSMSGISVASAESDGTGYAEIPTSLLPQGVYLLLSADWCERLLL